MVLGPHDHWHFPFTHLQSPVQQSLPIRICSSILIQAPYTLREANPTSILLRNHILCGRIKRYNHCTYSHSWRSKCSYFPLLSFLTFSRSTCRLFRLSTPKYIKRVVVYVYYNENSLASFCNKAPPCLGRTSPSHFLFTLSEYRLLMCAASIRKEMCEGAYNSSSYWWMVATVRRLPNKYLQRDAFLRKCT